jgi:hypothetical protein
MNERGTAPGNVRWSHWAGEGAATQKGSIAHHIASATTILSSARLSLTLHQPRGWIP